MPITEKQKEMRINHLGGSDMAAILGVDPYRNAYDVYLEKTEQLKEGKVSDAAEAGNYLEDGVLNFAEARLGKLVRNQYRSAKERGIDCPIGVNCDAIIVEPNNGDAKKGEPVEAKTSQLYYYRGGEWGKEGTDEVPDRTILQCHAQMLCTGTETCHVPALVGGKGLVMYHVNIDEELKELLIVNSNDFWNNHVLKNIPPEDLVPSLPVIKRIKREPDTIIEIPQDIVSNWILSKEQLKAAEKNKKSAESLLLAALGTAEAGRCREGTVTYLETHRKGYEVKPSTYRTLRYKKEKK